MKSQSRLTGEMIHHIEETHEFFESIKNTIAQHIEAEHIVDQQLASGVEGIQQAASLKKWINMKRCFSIAKKPRINKLQKRTCLFSAFISYMSVL